MFPYKSPSFGLYIAVIWFLAIFRAPDDSRAASGRAEHPRGEHTKEAPYTRDPNSSPLDTTLNHPLPQLEPPRRTPPITPSATHYPTRNPPVLPLNTPSTPPCPTRNLPIQPPLLLGATRDVPSRPSLARSSRSCCSSRPRCWGGSSICGRSILRIRST